MNLFSIIEEIEKVDPEFNDRISPRRDAIKNITSFGSKVAVAAVPFALGTLFKKAYGQTASATVLATLNFALTLELLEAGFYNTGMGTSGLVGDASYVAHIQADENNHVTFLTNAISAAGGTPVTKASFKYVDYTGGSGSGNGPFANVFSNYTTFLEVALAFEDTGVRAYKGQAPNLLGNQTYLTAALDIHAVEARHASAIRYLLSTKGVAITPWITSSVALGNDTGIAQVNANYAGATPENTTVQGGVNILNLPSPEGTTTSEATATAAFDEPLTMAEVLAILVPAFAMTN
ncbi:ferritin-like domain-containing protein [Mucilaginibacter sp.]